MVDYSELKKAMQAFSMSTLKHFLGDDIVDSLIEWAQDDESIYTKTRLIQLIITVKGLRLLKEKGFRKELLLRVKPEKLLGFVQYLPLRANEDDLSKIINAIVAVPWRDNVVSRLFLDLFNIDKSLLSEQREEEQIVNELASDGSFYELLDYQYVIRQKALNVLNSDITMPRLLIHMPTGTGKTKTATHIICNFYNNKLNRNGLIVWIAHTTELLYQAYATFVNVWKHLGNGRINTYKIWGNNDIPVSDTPLNGFMVCGIQKLIAIKNSKPALFEKIVKDASLIVYDEAHKAAASETRTTIESLMTMKEGAHNRALMGLTATPGRSTQQSFDNALLSAMFDNRIISIDTRLMNEINLTRQQALNAEVETDIIGYFQKRHILSKIKKEQLTYQEQLSESELKKIKVTASDNGYEDFSKTALETIGKNRSRNLRILQKLRELNEKQIPTIVFACSVQHAQLLSSMLTIEGIPNATVIGDMPKIERENAISQFKDRTNSVNILINYEVLTTGFDSKNIRCVFITRPTQSVVLYSQMLGRGLRGPLMGGNEECLLVDIKDNLRQYNEHMAFSHFDNYWKN